MIIANGGKVGTDGAKEELVAELAVVMLHMMETEGIVDNDIIYALAMAMDSKKQRDEKKDKFREDFINKLFE
jgi:hypothetical protein